MLFVGGIVRSYIVFWLTLILVFAVSTQAEVVKIGLIAPLEALHSQIGEEMRNGALLAEEEINADKEGKFHLEVLVENGEYTPAKATATFESLTKEKNAHYIIGPFNFGQTKVLAPLANEKKILLIGNYSKAPEISDAGDYVFRLTYNSLSEAAFLGRFIASHMKSETLSALVVDDQISTMHITAIEKALKEGGKKLGLVEKFSVSAKDIRPQILRIRRTKPTDILILAPVGKLGSIVKQALEWKVSARFYSLGAEENEIIKSVGNLPEELVFSSAWTKDLSYDSVKEFTLKYDAKFKREASFAAAVTYDATQLVMGCVERGGDSVELTRKCLYEVKAFSGASGPLSIDEKGDAIRHFYAKKTQDGGALVIQ